MLFTEKQKEKVPQNVFTDREKVCVMCVCNIENSLEKKTVLTDILEGLFQSV